MYSYECDITVWCRS